MKRLFARLGLALALVGAVAFAAPAFADDQPAASAPAISASVTAPAADGAAGVPAVAPATAPAARTCCACSVRSASTCC